MTLDTFLSDLSPYAAEDVLVFSTEAGPISGGYHATEFKLADIRSIDCGARLDRFSETIIQILDGSGDDHMSVGKFRKIAGIASSRIDGLANASLSFEFAPGNLGLRRYDIQSVSASDGTVNVQLGEKSAACKPALDRKAGLGQTAPTGSSCCGSRAEAASNCCA